MRGNVVNGAIADAKKDLATKFPLVDNEAYTNTTIDIAEFTTKRHFAGLFGNVSQVGKILEKKYKIVISSDIISFGDQNNKRVLNDIEYENSDHKKNETIHQDLYSVGDSVLYKGEVVKILSVSPSSEMIRIQILKSGKYREKQVWTDQVNSIE